jgi:hypothetical protein
MSMIWSVESCKKKYSDSRSVGPIDFGHLVYLSSKGEGVSIDNADKEEE